MSETHLSSSLSRPKWAVRSVLALAVAAVVGCDDLGKSDKATVAAVDAAVNQLAVLPTLNPGEGVNTVSSSLVDAANKASDGAFKAVAAAAAAAVDQQAAFASVIKLKDQEAAVRRTLVELRRLADQVATSNAYATGYVKVEPKEAVGKLSENIATLQGVSAGVKQDAAKYQADLDQKQQQLADLQKKRNDLLSTAQVQRTHADSLKGDEAVRAFGDASESQRAADDLAINIDLVQVQTDRLKQDLAVSSSQAQITDTGIENLKSQGKLLESGWIKTQEAAASQKKVVASAITGDDKTPQSIDSTLQTLGKQLAEMTTARSAALEQLNEAKKYADMAFDQASKFGATLSARIALPGKEGESYTALKNAAHPQQFQYLAGVVQSDLGALALSQASLYQDVKSAVDSVRTTVEAAGQPVPDALAKLDLSPLEQLLKDADSNLDAAATTLTNVESGDSDAKLKNAAKKARLITLFAYLNLYTLRESTGDTSAKALAQAKMSDAVQLKGELVGNNVPLPALPGELGDATAGLPPAATPTPTPTPAPGAETPATPPADTQPATPTPGADGATPPAAQSKAG